MSKHKTRQQKIIADLHRKLQSQGVGVPIYTYKHPEQKITVPLSVNTTATTINMAPIKHDLIKTAVVTMAIIASQLLLFYLLKNHLITIPMIGY